MKLRIPFHPWSRSGEPDAAAAAGERVDAAAVLEAELDALHLDAWTAEELEELREFVAADGAAAVRADPTFKERLRLDLWWMLVARMSGSRSGDRRG